MRTVEGYSLFDFFENIFGPRNEGLLAPPSDLHNTETNWFNSNQVGFEECGDTIGENTKIYTKNVRFCTYLCSPAGDFAYISYTAFPFIFIHLNKN